MKRVCVFCGSSTGVDDIYAEAARSLAASAAEASLGIVYGGGNIGLMGILADAALKHGLEVIGVIPQSLVDRELAHQGLTKLHIVHSMHERKALMAELSDGFIALPGGYGTWEELFEIVTWGQLGLHRKACGLLNVNGYYDPILTQLKHATATGFIREEHRRILLVESDPRSLLDKLISHKPPHVPKWIKSDET